MIQVVLHVVTAFVFLCIAGYGVVEFAYRFYGNDNRFQGRGCVYPAVGYCIVQMLFFCGYVVFENARLAMYFSVAVPVFLTLVFSLFAGWNRRAAGTGTLSRLGQGIDRDGVVVLLCLGGLLAFALWPYMIIGEGNYYHSGNEDFFDGLNGGVAYLSDLPLSIMHSGYQGTFRLQYSSIALWSQLFGYWNPMDAFTIQCAVNLGGTFLGVYWLLRHVFLCPFSVSLISGLFSVLGNFYFTTFLAGHMGSMMYGAIAPFFLGTAVQWVRGIRCEIPEGGNFLQALKRCWRRHLLLILPALFLVYNQYTYPGPLNFIIVPLILYAGYRLVVEPAALLTKIRGFFLKPPKETVPGGFRVGRIFLCFLPVGLAGVCAVWWMWEYFESARVFDIIRGSQESWQIAHYREIFMIFWGLFPSDLVGSYSLGPLLYNHRVIYGVALCCAFLFLGVTLKGAWRLSKDISVFFGVYTILWPLFAVMMKYFFGAPYYLYKFYYVNYFLVLSCFIFGLFTLGGGGRFSRMICIALLTVFMVPNMAYNLMRQVDLMERPYHRVGAIAEMKEKLVGFKDIGLAIPNDVNSLVFSKMLIYNGMKPVPKDRAEYLLRILENPDVVHSPISGEEKIWWNDIFEIVGAPKKNKVEVITSYLPGNTVFGPLRWVSDRVMEKDKAIQKLIADTIAGIPGRLLDGIYFDIKDPRFLKSARTVYRKMGRRMTSEPHSAQLFLKFKDLPGLGHVRSMNDFYYPVPGEKLVWENTFFMLVEVPFEGRRVIIPHSFDIAGLLNVLNNLKGGVFIEIPRFEPLYHFLKHDIRVESENLTEDPILSRYSVRLRLPVGLRHQEYKFFEEGAARRVVWSSAGEQLRESVRVEIVELVDNPRPSKEVRLPDLSSMLLIKKEKYGAAFKVVLNDIRDPAKYLNLVVGPGPSIGMAPFTLMVEDSDGNPRGEYAVEGNTHISIPIKSLGRPGRPVVFRGKDLKGRSLMPVDPRILDMKLLFAEVSDGGRMSHRAVSVLNGRLDDEFLRTLPAHLVRDRRKMGEVVSGRAREAGIAIGDGWYDLEKYDGEIFRWVGTKATLIAGGSGKGEEQRLFIELKLGPSSGGNMSLELLDAGGTLLSTTPIKGTALNRVGLTLPWNGKETGPRMFTLRSVSPNVSLKGDARILNFRVFSITLE